MHIHATSTLVGLTIGKVRMLARAMAACLARLVLRTSRVSCSFCYVSNNPWCVSVCVRVGYGTFSHNSSSQHVDRAWHRQCLHTGPCCASSLRQFRGQNIRGRLAFCTLKATVQRAWWRLYDQDTVRIQVEYGSHMQIRLNTCTPYILANTNTLIQGASMLPPSISTRSWNLWT